MTSKGQSNSEQISEQGSDWQPPWGVRFFEDRSRPSPFFVQWREDGGTRKTKAFDKERLRLTWTKSFVEDRERKESNAIADFDPQEWIRWQEFKRIVGAGADPLTIAVEWKQRQVASAIPFADAANRYLAAREAEGGMEYATLSHARQNVRRMVAHFAGLGLSEITPEAVRAFLTALPLAQETKKNHYKRLTALFNWAKRERLVTFNPCESVEAPQRVSDDVTVLPARDAFALFKTAWKIDPAVCARLALETFAGIRFGTAAQLVKDDINFADHGVTLPAAAGKKTEKVRKRHYIEHLPDNLWEWLNAAPASAWTLTPRQYLAAKSRAFSLAMVENPGNVLRHSFCSYHVSVHADAAKTAVILCHASPSTLWQHYRGRATSADGKLYFAITPESVALSWEQFQAQETTNRQE